ncbi:hypothetical protein EYF80_040393 [Liparis tanakae]|uniref:Uncharacterized protein n=1 Tax=Liparis tanakae TaxID=230148 RepID=A0A4Z2G840_9TELE|nr:hypothetical protein EYF80_040393 [Liparis tanakae]
MCTLIRDGVTPISQTGIRAPGKVDVVSSEGGSLHSSTPGGAFGSSVLLHFIAKVFPSLGSSRFTRFTEKTGEQMEGGMWKEHLHVPLLDGRLFKKKEGKR